MTLADGEFDLETLQQSFPGQLELVYEITRASRLPVGQRPAPPPARNALAMMMSRAQQNGQRNHLPEDIEEPRTGVEELFNQLLQYVDEVNLDGKKPGFLRDVAEGEGRCMFMDIAKAFYKLTHFQKHLYGNVREECKPPRDFARFCGYSAFARGSTRKSRPLLDQKTCKEVSVDVSDIIYKYSAYLKRHPWQRFEGFLRGVENALDKRLEHLKQQAEAKAERFQDGQQLTFSQQYSRVFGVCAACEAKNNKCVLGNKRSKPCTN